LCESNDSEHDEFGFLVFRTIKIIHVQNQEGNRVEHSINHQNPVQPAPWYNAKQENHNKTGERVPINANKLKSTKSYLREGETLGS
jgi:hypothetical protein